MKRWLQIARTGLLLAATSQLSYAQVDSRWKIHDTDRRCRR